MAKKMKKKRETEKERMERKEKIAKKREKKLARKIAKREAVATVEPVEPDEPVVDEWICDEVCEEMEEFDVDTLSPDIFEDTSLWWGEFNKLDWTCELGLFYATFENAGTEEFWEKLEPFDAVIEVFHRSTIAERVEDGIKLLETLKAQRPEQYMEHFEYYDCDLLYHYAPRNEDWRIDEIIGHFEKEPERDVDNLFVVLDLLRIYGMADGLDRLSTASYHRLKCSDQIVPSGDDELHHLTIFCSIRKYVASPDYGTKEAEEEFHRELEARDFWKYGAKEEADERLQTVVSALRGETGQDLRRNDFLISDDRCEDNVFLLGMAFIRYLYTEKSIEWVTGDLFRELALDYFARVSAQSELGAEFYFSFSKEYLDKYLLGFFGFLSLSDAKGMAVLKAMEHFSSFLHERGIYDNREFTEVKRAIREFKKPIGKMYERKSWKYGFVEMWE
ncbi:MAG: hypothetical protein U9N46_13040 [Euryarchaeota archaeon]|nr:hypothetical protein [Euryarchaeota archaeon]